MMGLAVCAGALACAAPVQAGLAAAVGALAVARAGARVKAIALAAAFAFGAVRANAAVQAAEKMRAAIVATGGWPARCVLRGEVAASPVVVSGSLRVDVREVALDCGRPAGLAAPTTLHLPVDGPSLATGDEISAIAQLAPTQRFWNGGDPRPSYARRAAVLSGGAEDAVVLVRARGWRAALDRAREHVRRRIQATFPSPAIGMARALVLGEEDLAPCDQQAFRQSGLSHLLAVSGMHLVLVVVGVVAALRAVFVRVPAIAARIDPGRVAAAIGLPLTWGYAIFAGASGSALRAAWMSSAALAAFVLGRQPHAGRALGISVLAMAVSDPLAAFDVSFSLSALATMGVMFLTRPAHEALRRGLPALPELVARPFATTLAATVACAPVLACIAPNLPLAGLFANLVAVPLGEAAALPLCLLHALVEPVALAERGCALAASGALLAVARVAHVAAASAWGALPVPLPTAGQLALLGTCAFCASLGPAAVRRWLFGGLAGVIALEMVARVRGAPHGVLRVTFLDVGQGDAALVDLPDGRAVLIDGGGLVGSPVDTGERVVAPFLRARRRSWLDAAVLSHPHPDHFLGLRSALATVGLRALWDTGQGELDPPRAPERASASPVLGPYAELLAAVRARGVPVLRPADLCGSRAFGGATIDVLAPCPGPDLDRGPNDNSLVVRIRYGERAVLFVGDAERDEEATLLATRAPWLRADVLKVGHHGSRTSTSGAFVAAVAPSIGVVSAGVRNRFGHPHAVTLATLANAGVRVFRTDRDGAIVVETDGRSLAARASSTEWLAWD